ncbi:uncharacterized protein EV154DRAFT_549452 [Mucor mucedo]|uniref:uncharacterized protein n=1 Tax=Mucor mucedo TaxID=29922 RepID=UPI00222054B1|nr:uncharacterized protein EV154DRAFT_549452 [Mucor mucedo]KAI7893997.1 hypothetical protein EV154DRAFT_549452 [Mucor mucedo]
MFWSFLEFYRTIQNGTNNQTDIITSLEAINNIQAEKIICLEQKLSAVENQLGNMNSEKLELEQAVAELTTCLPGGSQVIINRVQKRTKEVQASLAACEKDLQSRNLYVQELEARNKNLMAEMNVKKVPEIAEDNLIRSLQNDKANLKAEVEIVQAKLDKLEEEYLALEVEAALFDNEEETQGYKYRLDKLERDNRESTSRIQHLEVELIRANDEKETWKKMHEIAKERLQETNRIKYNKVDHNKTKQELAYTKEQLVKSAADYTLSQRKLDQLQKAIRDLQSENNKIQQNRDELQLRVDNLTRSKARNPAAISFSEQENADINPALVTKINSLKATNLMYKDENNYLKEHVHKPTMSLSKNQNMDDLLKSGSSDHETGNMVDYMHDKSPRESKSKRRSSILSHQPTDSVMIPSRSVKSTSLLNTASSHQTPKLSEPSVNPARGLNVTLGKPAVATQQGLHRSASRLSPPVSARPPIPAVVPKGKKKDSRLKKFVNSRNPGKFIDSRPILLPVHDRPPSMEERVAKKTRMDMRYVSIVEEWVQKKKLPNVTDSAIDNILKEINSNFKVMKSIDNPDPKTMSKYGIEGLYQIDAKAFHDILTRLSAELVKCLKAKRPDVSGSRYRRLLCLLYKSRGDVERTRTLCFDVVRESTCNNNTFACLYNIVCGWQDSLVSGKKPSLLLKAVQSSIQHIYDHSGIPDNVKVMYTEITKRCDWNALNRIPPTSEVIEEVMVQLLRLEGVPVTSE